MRINLKLNKEIIDGFFKELNLNDKENLLILKLKEENDNLFLLLERMKKEIEDLRNKSVHYENLLNVSKLNQINVTEPLLNKIFILENQLIQKENLTTIFNLKLENFYKMLENDENVLIKEVFVLNPTEATNLMHDELMVYKHSHENLILNIKEKKEKIDNFQIIFEVIFNFYNS